VKFTKDEMGFVVGRTALAIAAITDCSLALALVKALGEPEKYKDCLAALEEKSQKLKKRQAEAKAHERNVRKGKK
jgi:predicted phosphoribosyltransferase